MEWVTTEAFLAWTNAKSLRTRPNDAEISDFELPGGTSRYWTLPENRGAIPRFLDHLLRGLEGWAGCFVFPQFGDWTIPVSHAEPASIVYETVMNWAGISRECDGPVFIPAIERDSLLAILCCHVAFQHRATDLFVLPDHGRQILQIDHHGVVHVTCVSAGLMKTFAEHMKAGGFALPSEPPDWTFKPVSKMSQE